MITLQEIQAHDSVYTNIQALYESALPLLLMTYGAPANTGLAEPVALMRKYVYGVK